MRFFQHTLMSLLVLALFVGGCASIMPDSSEEAEPPYFVSEFSDVSIPSEMSEVRGETYITFTPAGIKTGVQQFSGRVENVPLMNVLRRNMVSSGWALRTLLRSNQSIMAFEKDDRICIMHIVDGMINTELTIFMSSRLAGDIGAADAASYSHPEAAR